MLEKRIIFLFNSAFFFCSAARQSEKLQISAFLCRRISPRERRRNEFVFKLFITFTYLRNWNRMQLVTGEDKVSLRRLHYKLSCMRHDRYKFTCQLKCKDFLSHTPSPPSGFEKTYNWKFSVRRKNSKHSFSSFLCSSRHTLEILWELA